MYNVYLLTQHDVTKHWEEGKDSRKGHRSIYDRKRDVVDLDPIREIAYALAIVVGVSDDDHFMATIYELGGKLIYVTFDSTWLWKEEVAHHGDVIRSAPHVGGSFWRFGDP